MDTNLSIAVILSSLEAQIAQQREQEALHAEREAFHRERRAGHAAELERLLQTFETFRASAASAADLAARHLATAAPEPAPAPEPADDLPPGRRVSINLMVARVIEGKGAQEPFGPRAIAEEVNRRFAGRLQQAVDMRQVSVSLRWFAGNRSIFRLEKGRPHWESKYVRQLPPE
jgi:hypothetical protein